MGHVVAVIQARMGSRRLPGKVLAQAAGRSLLEIELDRVSRSKSLDAIVIGTTERSLDEPIVELAERHRVAVFRGSEDDVLARYEGAAAAASADTIVRLTADCPLLGPDVVDAVVGAHLAANGEFDLTTNAVTNGRTYPDGMDVEVFSRAALESAHREARRPAEREHVTPWIRAHGRVQAVQLPEDLGHVRLTVDTAEDLDRVRRIAEGLLADKPYSTLEDILDFLRKQPEHFG